MTNIPHWKVESRMIRPLVNSAVDTPSNPYWTIKDGLLYFIYGRTWLFEPKRRYI